MSYSIEPRKVAGVVIECNNQISALRANHGEVLMGLAELIGRVIVDAAKTHIEADAMYQVVQKRVLETIEVGSQARAKSLITPRK